MALSNPGQITIIIGLLVLMAIALIIDGDFGDRTFGLLIGSFGFVLGYFFRKSGTTSQI